VWPTDVAGHYRKRGLVRILEDVPEPQPEPERPPPEAPGDAPPGVWNGRRRRIPPPVYVGGGMYQVGSERIRGKAAAGKRWTELTADP
jgi:hypothetical protein